MERFEAEVYKYLPEKDRYYVKIAFLGIYVNGITVQPSKLNPGEQMVQPPSYWSGNRWGHYVEFHPTSAWREPLERLVREAVERYKQENGIK